jgi:hypothetical protein
MFYMGLGFSGDEDFTEEITELFTQLHISSKPEKLARVSYYFLVIILFSFFGSTDWGLNSGLPACLLGRRFTA